MILTVLIFRSALVQYMKSNEEREQEKMDKWGGNRPVVATTKKDGKIHLFGVKKIHKVFVYIFFVNGIKICICICNL